ncbi:MAG: MOSC domain-containing protein [Cyanobacteria bacterium RM1_2_2]|nr:MOSC domain-containing protein [Cyanobacteria bacterium RM1_2_2]
MTLTVTDLYIYPIKSCRGIRRSVAELDAWGLQYDRNWMVVTPAGKFLTQRDVPRLALIDTAIESEHLCVQSPNQSALRLPLVPPVASVKKGLTVEVWRDRCQAIDQGDEAAAWFSQFLAMDCRLVRIGEAYNRPVQSSHKSNQPSAQVSFADAYPLLLISDASLADLNQRLPQPLPMNRFRPNLVITGCEPYAEDRWQQIRVDQTIFDVAKPCQRCVITTTDQQTAIRDAAKEPLKTLATYRRLKGGVIFGQNLIHTNPGKISVGSAVEVLS